MIEWMESFTQVIAHILEFIAVIMIAIGGFQAAAQSFWAVLRRRTNQKVRRHSWLNFARWLLLGLEFALGADIVRTVVSPTWDTIGQLAAIAFIRTFLSYFLERDLEAAAKAHFQDPQSEEL